MGLRKSSAPRFRSYTHYYRYGRRGGRSRRPRSIDFPFRHPPLSDSFPIDFTYLPYPFRRYLPRDTLNVRPDFPFRLLGLFLPGFTHRRGEEKEGTRRGMVRRGPYERLRVTDYRRELRD